MSDVMNDDLTYKVGEDAPMTTAREWWRGENCNFIPSRTNLQEEDAIDKYILDGWLPGSKLINRSTYVTAFGSCFAHQIRKRLREYSSYTPQYPDLPIIHYGEAINNTFAILQQFRWALWDENFDGLWHDKDINLVVPTEEMRANTKEVFEKTEVFILTLGLSEVWCNTMTGNVFWRAIPKENYDPERHSFRVSSVEENRQNLLLTTNIIRQFNPKAKIIFTLSPVPLNATFRPVSCITANSVSKAILRVAVDEVMRMGISNLYYWPAYEIVKEFFPQPYQDDNRHIHPNVTKAILDKFARYYME